MLIWNRSRKYRYRIELSAQIPTYRKTQPHNTQHACLYQLTPQPLIIQSPDPVELNSQVRQKPPGTLDVPSHPNTSEKCSHNKTSNSNEDRTLLACLTKPNQQQQKSSVIPTHTTFRMN